MGDDMAHCRCVSADNEKAGSGLCQSQREFNVGVEGRGGIQQPEKNLFRCKLHSFQAANSPPLHDCLLGVQVYWMWGLFLATTQMQSQQQLCAF